jgi:hypothetical protein
MHAALVLNHTHTALPRFSKSMHSTNQGYLLQHNISHSKPNHTPSNWKSATMLLTQRTWPSWSRTSCCSCACRCWALACTLSLACTPPPPRTPSCACTAPPPLTCTPSCACTPPPPLACTPSYACTAPPPLTGTPSCACTPPPLKACTPPPWACTPPRTCTALQTYSHASRTWAPPCKQACHLLQQQQQQQQRQQQRRRRGSSRTCECLTTFGHKQHRRSLQNQHLGYLERVGRGRPRRHADILASMPHLQPVKSVDRRNPYQLFLPYAGLSL